MRVFKWVGQKNSNYWKYLIVNENKVYKKKYDETNLITINDEETMVKNWEWLNKYLDEGECVEVFNEEANNIKIELL